MVNFGPEIYCFRNFVLLHVSRNPIGHISRIVIGRLGEAVANSNVTTGPSAKGRHPELGPSSTDPRTKKAAGIALTRGTRLTQHALNGIREWVKLVETVALRIAHGPHRCFL